MALCLARCDLPEGAPGRADRQPGTRIFRQNGPAQVAQSDDRAANSAIHLAPKVPTTAVYSRTDGICAWQNCIEEETDLTENIEVKASHCGLGHHPAVVYAIADRLSQPEGAWQKFDRGGVRAMIYPKPSYAV